MKVLATCRGLTAHQSEGGVVIDGLPEPVEVRAGDRLVLTWGGMAAAVCMTPIDLDLVSGSRTISLLALQLLDEHEPDYHWQTSLDAVRAFASAIAVAAGISVEES